MKRLAYHISDDIQDWFDDFHVEANSRLSDGRIWLIIVAITLLMALLLGGVLNIITITYIR